MKQGKTEHPLFLEFPKMASALKRAAAEWLLGSSADVSETIGALWKSVKSYAIVPVVRFSLYLCLLWSFLLFLEWAHMMCLAALAKCMRRKHAKRYKWEPLKDDLESGSLDFPMVLVQIPIYNEIEVCFFVSVGFVLID